MSEYFYSPLGIYSNPIAIAHDKLNNVHRGSLGVLFHKEIASLVKRVNPATEALITRPLPPMVAVFKNSKIPFVQASSFVPLDEKKPIGIERVYLNGRGYKII